MGQTARRLGTVGAVRRHGGNGRRGGGGLNGKGGAARRKERHGKERRHDGRPRQRTAELWAAGQTAERGRDLPGGEGEAILQLRCEGPLARKTESRGSRASTRSVTQYL